MIELKKCPICQGVNFHDLDYLRDHEVWEERDYLEPSDKMGFKVCKTCGFVTYDYCTDAELDRRYAKIRPRIDYQNLVTGWRKIEYHKKFLNEYFAHKEMLEGFTVMDYGASIGMFLEWFKKQYPIAEIRGIELSDVSRNVAKGYYDIDLYKNYDEIPEDEKYDLVAMYHTFEHLQWPDKELDKIITKLKPDALIYVAIPDYLDKCKEHSGMRTVEFENLYHLNHVNCFSKKSFKNILWSKGFEIIQEDDIMYGYTVLAKYTGKIKPFEAESYKEIEKILQNQKKAMGLVKDGKFEEAIKIYPRYPEAWASQVLTMKTYKDFKKAIATLDKALEICDNDCMLLRHKGDTLFKWDQAKKSYVWYSDNIKEAERIFTYLAEHKPGEEMAFFYLGMIEGKYKGNDKKAREYIEKVYKINPLKTAEMVGMIFMALGGNLPETKGEVPPSEFNAVEEDEKSG